MRWREGVPVRVMCCPVTVGARIEVRMTENQLQAAGPGWWESFAALFTDAGVGVLYAGVLLCWWRARQLPAQRMARAMLAPVGVLAAYVISSGIKLLAAAERPCQALVVRAVIECPPTGDWSFPSNHAALAGACAVGVACAWARLAIPAALVAIAVAASRVVVGVHYVHDVIAGLTVGSATAALVVWAMLRPTTNLVERLRARPACDTWWRRGQRSSQCRRTTADERETAPVCAPRTPRNLPSALQAARAGFRPRVSRWVRREGPPDTAGPASTSRQPAWPGWRRSFPCCHRTR